MSSSFKAVVKKTKPATVAFLHVTGHYNQIPIALGQLYSWINEKDMFLKAQPSLSTTIYRERSPMTNCSGKYVACFLEMSLSLGLISRV